MKRTMIVGGILVVAAMLLAACGTTPAPQPVEQAATEVVEKVAEPTPEPATSSEEKTLISSLESEPRLIPVTVQYDNGGWFMSTLIFDRLTAMDYGPDFAIHPLLAESWEIGEDGKTYTFHLAKNVKWHDGVPFTSADVKFTFEGIVEQNAAAADVMSVLESVETPDDYTVVVHTKNVDAAFLPGLSVYPETHILPKHIYEGTTWTENPANMVPIGTGPYKWSEYVPGSHVTLVRNDEYWRGKAYFDKVIFKIIPDTNVAIAQLKAGEIDALNNPPPLQLQAALNEAPGVNVDMNPGPMIYFLAFNCTQAPFDDVKVRQALAYAIDREDVTNKVVPGVCKACEGVYESAVSWAYNPDTKLPAYDPGKAEQILDEAGYVKDANGVRFPMKITVSRAEYVAVAEVLKEQLRQIGVEVTLDQMEDGTLRTTLQNENRHQAYVYGNWWGPDPSEWATYLKTGEMWAKPLHYDNPEVDALFVQGRSSLDQAERAQYYYKIQEIVLRDMPRIPIFGSCPYSYAHTTKYVGWFSEQSVSYRTDVMKLKPAP